MTTKFLSDDERNRRDKTTAAIVRKFVIEQLEGLVRELKEDSNLSIYHFALSATDNDAQRLEIEVG